MNTDPGRAAGWKAGAGLLPPLDKPEAGMTAGKQQEGLEEKGAGHSRAPTSPNRYSGRPRQGLCSSVQPTGLARTAGRTPPRLPCLSAPTSRAAPRSQKHQLYQLGFSWYYSHTI